MRFHSEPKIASHGMSQILHNQENLARMVLHVHRHDFNARLDYLLKGTDLKRTNDGTKARCVGLGLGMAWISDIV